MQGDSLLSLVDDALEGKSPGGELRRGLGRREAFSSLAGSSGRRVVLFKHLPPSTALARASGEIRGIIWDS